MKCINLNDPFNRWRLDIVTQICNDVSEYTHKHGILRAEIDTIEDNTWADEVNRRYDVTIRYTADNGLLMEQKLLILKGEVIDGKEFHRRYDEFYGKAV